MYKNVRYLSNLKEIEYIKRKEMEEKKQVMLRITKFELSPSNSNSRIWIERANFK